MALADPLDLVASERMSLLRKPENQVRPLKGPGHVEFKKAGLGSRLPATCFVPGSARDCRFHGRGTGEVEICRLALASQTDFETIETRLEAGPVLQEAC